MKKCIYFSCFVLAILTFSCNDQKMNGHSEIAQKNLDAMKGVRQAIESKDLNKLGDFISADAVDHSGAQGYRIGRGERPATAKWRGKTNSNGRHPAGGGGRDRER